MNETGEENSLELPEPPTKPLDSDCCGNGCTPCVFDIYADEVRIWEEECTRLKTGHCSKNLNHVDHSSQDVLSTEEYRQFQLVQCDRETRDVLHLSFALPAGQTLGLTAGQHVIIRARVKGSPVTRQYTPVSACNTKGHFDLVIKLYEHGLMSQAVREWKTGDWIEMRGPCGIFTYTPNRHRRLLMLAAGTGLAPMAQVVAEVLDNEEDETLLHLLYACRTYTDILLKPQLDQWARFWNFSVTYALSQENCTQPSTSYKYGDKLHFGRITREMIGEALGPGDVYVLVCGSKTFEDDMINHLQSFGLEKTCYFRF